MGKAERISPLNDPALLLDNLAMMLNACESIKPKLKHGVVMTKAGYVLPVGDRWVARTLAYTPFSDYLDEEDAGW